MVDRVVANVWPLDNGETLVVTQDLVGQTKGAVDTILKVADRIDPEQPLVVANCDQLLIFDKPEMVGDGVIFTFPSSSPAHSYVRTVDDGLIVNIVEKQVISRQAVSGVYWFRQAGDFLWACRKVLDADDGRELYISEALKTMIAGAYDLYARQAKTAILGTPEDFMRFEVALECAS